MTDSNTKFTAPELPYRLTNPKSYNPSIALIGCGGITAAHLGAYKNAGYNVVALCDLDESRAVARQEGFYPNAQIYTDHNEVLKRDDIEVLDIATHPAARVPLIEEALNAGKHVLSQKPFVLDLAVGEKLIELADKKGVKLAVNQNGRWAPHIAYMRQAITQGVIGELSSADMSVHWDHSWVVGTPFDNIHDLVLYDFAIHWFDMLTCYFGDLEADRVYAATRTATGQTPKPPLLAHVIIDYPSAQATLSFNAATKFGQHDRTVLVGTNGTIQSNGPGLQDQTVTLYTEDGTDSPELEGKWFNDGFHGAMGELLCAIEEDRVPYNNPVDNLRSLALAFAAIGSAHDGQPKKPGDVRVLPEL